MFRFRKLCLPGLLLFFCAFPCFSQITVTSPSVRDDVKAGADFAAEVLLDRWDMNERTDLGWRIFNTLEQPLSYLTDVLFQSGIFSATSTYTGGTGDPEYSDANITILDSAYAGSAMLGKVGHNFPIDAGKYTILTFRMYLGPDAAGPYGQLLWSTNTIYGGITTSGSFFVRNGWQIYQIDIPNLGIAAGSDTGSGLIDSLRLDPTIKAGQAIHHDWIRLTDNYVLGLRSISWNGNAANVDIYLDDDLNSANGNLGLLAQNVNGNSFSFLAGGLAPGDYYVAVAPTGTTAYMYSPGYYHVNDIPILRVTKPSAEGSDIDFVTMTFSDPWDMANSEDVEHTEHVKNAQFTILDYEDLAGQSYSSRSVYYGENTAVTPPVIGDPNVFFLHFLWRGGMTPIISSRYHNLTFKMGIAGTQSVSDGSIARIMWKRTDEAVENVTQDIIIRHLPDKWIMNEIACDLSSFPLEAGAGSPSHSGWTGELDCFRIDPHEFSASRAFFFDEVRIAADWKANSSFSIEWDLSDVDSTCYVALYYDLDNQGFDGTLIASGIPASSAGDAYLWDTSAVPEGKYWLYARVTDGLNQNRCYAGGPVFIDHELIPVISLSKCQVYLGAEQNGPSTANEAVHITNKGQGALNWQASAGENWIEVNPAGGVGDGVIQIGVQDTSLPAGTYTGTVTVTDPKAWNSPRIINVSLTVYASGADSAPFGVFDSPLDGSTVSGNIPITGWALDDIEVSHVEIKRAPVAADPPAAVGPDGLISVGNVIFVKGARPDVEAFYPLFPRAEQAGWGYMMLTNFLPNQGNGTFTLYAFAYDETGHKVALGQKLIICDNAARVKPFGTLDTPGQGEVISGSGYVNFGWALTPQPKVIPEDGSTIWVWVDSVPLGNPNYGHYRVDIATLFPGYLNSDGAVGYYTLDTTAYANGMHNITWSVTDNEGEVDGIGSRYFEILNFGGQALGAIKPMTAQHLQQLREDRSGSLAIELREIRRRGRSNAKSQGVIARPDQPPVIARPEGPKRPLELEIELLERLEVHFQAQGGLEFIGWGENKNRPLPVGSTLDKTNGVFYWIPGPGFSGRHVLHFAVTDGTFTSKPLTLVINIFSHLSKISLGE